MEKTQNKTPSKKRITKISFGKFTGIILDDGVKIKDDMSGLIFEDVLHWISYIEKRKSPTNKNETMIDYYFKKREEYFFDEGVFFIEDIFP